MFISEFKIDNFRSLRNIHLKDMRPVCIFHGENNSGKSNILAAIEAILRAKTIIEDPGVVDDATATGKPTLAKQVSFHQGMLRGFADNFRFGSKDPIPFLLSLTFENSELAANKGVLEQIDPKRIPYGSKVVFPDRACTAVDTGSAVVSRKAARLCGRTASELKAIVVDRFFETKREAMAWRSGHPEFMTLQVVSPGSDSEPSEL
jgi:3D (Asp-Asp-Asp) domain-containing protein